MKDGKTLAAERLQKILSQAGVASRRAAEKMIAEGRVTVNGKTVTEPGVKADAADDRIAVDGKPLAEAERLRYYLLNKPKGYISTAKDERGRRTVLDLLPETAERLYPVGRLDNNTEGLLLLTNDGALTNALLHPAREIQKTYVAVVEGQVTAGELRRLRQGVELADGLTAPAGAFLVERDVAADRTKMEITLHEGRNRQVRRMCEAVGHRVRSLKRIQFAGLTLDGLRRGASRPLTRDEVRGLYALAGLPLSPDRRREETP